MKHNGILLLEILFLFFILCTISVSGQEVMFHYNAEHTGDFSPVAGTIGNAVSLKWKYETGGEVKSTPVVSNGIVYVGSDDHKVYALNAANGKQLWNFTTNGPISSTPAVGNGSVYIGSTDLYAINSTTGRQIWNFTPDFPVDYSELAITNGIIYFQAGKTYALNASDGSLIWAFSPFDNLDRKSWFSPAVANGVVYSGFIDGNIYALNATTGSQIWNYSSNSCSCGVLIFSSPAITNDVVYIARYELGPDTKLYAINATTGLKIWDYPITYYSSPVVSDGIVYVVVDRENLHAINTTTGQLLWKFKAGLRISSPAVANGAVFFGSVDDSKIYAVNAKTGQQIWNYSTEDMVISNDWGVISSPAIADGVLFIGSSDKNVYALNISGGVPLIPETKTIPTSKYTTAIPEPTKAGILWLTVICAMIIALIIKQKKMNFK